MAQARLEAFLGLNSRGFQRGLVKARREANEFAKRGLQAIAVAGVAAGAALAAGSRRIIKMGGDLEHLRTQTSVAVRDLMILRQAFEDNGVSSDNARLAINKMQRSLIEAGEGLSEPVKAFEALGLSVDELRKMSAVDQFRAIGEAIKRIEDPAERSAAAMRIFGRAGAELQSVFEGSKLADVEASLGRMPEVMDEFATALERADTLIGRLSNKADQFLAGFTTEIVGSLLPALEEINNKDFTELGQNLGKAIRPWIEAITSGEIWDLFGLMAAQSVAGFTGDMIDAAQEVGRVIVVALKSAFEVAVDRFKVLMSTYLSTVPLIGRAVKPYAGSGEGFGDAFARNFAPTRSNEFGKQFREAWQPEIDAITEKFKKMGEANTEAAKGMSNVAKAAGGNGTTDQSGAAGALTAMTNAASSFIKLMGFTVDDAASGKRGGGLVTHRARERQRLMGDAQRLFDTAARFDTYSTPGSADRAAEFRQRAQAKFAQAQAIDIPGISAQPTIPGPANATTPQPTSGSGASGGGNLASEVRALISELRQLAERIGIGPASI